MELREELRGERKRGKRDSEGVFRCLDDVNRSLDDTHCARENRDETERQCNRFPCPRWIYGMWSEVRDLFPLLNPFPSLFSVLVRVMEE